MKYGPMFDRPWIPAMAIIAMLIFLAVFCVVLWRVFSSKNAETISRASGLPLDEGRGSL